MCTSNPCCARPNLTQWWRTAFLPHYVTAQLAAALDGSFNRRSSYTSAHSTQCRKAQWLMGGNNEGGKKVLRYT